MPKSDSASCQQFFGDCTISNWSKPIKFAHLQELANQCMMNVAHVIEIIKTSRVAFMKARNSWVARCEEKRIKKKKKKKKKNGENVFFKTLAKKYRLTLKLIRRVKKQQRCLWPTFYQMESSWKDKDNNILVKVSWMNSLLEKSPWKCYWSTDERRVAWSKLLMVFVLHFPFICYLGKIYK